MQNMDRKQQNEDRFNEKEYYKTKIIEMVKEINNYKQIYLIYHFVKTGYSEEKGLSQIAK